VAEDLLDKLVLAWPMLEGDCACRVPELMHRRPQSGHLINPVCDLAAEQDAGFGAAALPREQLVIVAARSNVGLKS
jgi:hypothetical protein